MFIQHVFAFLLPLLIFTFWGVIGWATLGLLSSQRYTFQNLLIAPTVGMVVVLLCVFRLNMAGIPVGIFAVPLTIILGSLSVIILIYKRPVFPLKQSYPFFCVLLLGLLLTGWPLLEFGLNWVSYVNDDMNNYCLAATRFLNNGYLVQPSLNHVQAKTDYSLLYYAFHVLNSIRPGSELLLAWIAGSLKLLPIQIYMPVILAMQLCLISATAGLTLTFGHRRRLAGFIAALGVVLSAPATLGVSYQLIAQVGGIAILAVALIYFWRFPQEIFYRPLQYVVLLSAIFATLFIEYSEVLSFWGLVCLIKCVLERKILRKVVWRLLACGGLTLCFLGTWYAKHSIGFALSQSSGALVLESAQVFPYLLVPSGLANWMGLQPIGSFYHPAFLQSVVILISALFIFSSLVAVRALWNRFHNSIGPAPIMLVGMYLVFPMFFFKNAGFPAFKLSMYVQPFFYATIGSYLAIWASRSVFLALGVLLLGNIPVQHYYVQRARALIPGPLTEAVWSSSARFVSQLRLLAKTVPAGRSVFSDTWNIGIAKLETMSFRNIPLFFFTRDYFENIKKVGEKDLIFKEMIIQPEYWRSGLIEPIYFASLQQRARPDDLLLSYEGDVFNHREIIQKTGHNVWPRVFSLQPYSKVKNHLSYIDSNLGPLYTVGITRKQNLPSYPNAAFWQNEPDPSGLQEYLNTFGHTALFSVINPSPNIRVEVSFSKGFIGDGINQLPKESSISGQKRYSIGFVGRGSAHIFTQLIQPKKIEKHAYILVDMGAVHRFPDSKRGLMRLYGTHIPQDARQLSGLMRNLSIISDEDYHRLIPPSELKHFPQDLADPNLEYSGIYEDGWISEDAFFVLTQPDDRDTLHIQGEIPTQFKALAKQQVEILLDGKVLAKRELVKSKFDIRIPVDSARFSHKRRLTLHFTNVVSLGGRDDRPVSARMTMIGFE